MINNHLQSVMDIQPWPNGLGFRNAEDWWKYVGRQSEADKLDLLITMAHLSREVCQALLRHDRALLDRFQFLCPTIECLSAIQVNSLADFAASLIEQNTIHLKGGI